MKSVSKAFKTAFFRGGDNGQPVTGCDQKACAFLAASGQAILISDEALHFVSNIFTWAPSIWICALADSAEILRAQCKCSTPSTVARSVNYEG